MPKNSSLSPMVVMGLGNPGVRYENTRHNVGYRVADRLMEEPSAQWRRRLFSSFYHAELSEIDAGRPILLVRYTGFMNSSGAPLPAILKRWSVQPADLLVVVDNMDLRPGTCRLRRGGGSAGHNGLKSIAMCTGTTEFLRLYIGVGRPADGTSVIDHVLGVPVGDDVDAIDQACRRGAAGIRDLAVKPFDRVAEELNRRAP